MPSGSKSNTPASNTMVRDIGEKVGVEKTVDNPPRDEGNGGSGGDVCECVCALCELCFCCLECLGGLLGG
jgi:hypothetical protein